MPYFNKFMVQIVYISNSSCVYGCNLSSFYNANFSHPVSKPLLRT